MRVKYLSNKCLLNISILILFAMLSIGYSQAQTSDDSIERRVEKDIVWIKQWTKSNVPDFHLVKILSMINSGNIPKEEKDSILYFYQIPHWGGMNTIIAQPNFQSLSPSELFTYCMINYEWYNQNCSGRIITKEDEPQLYGTFYRKYREFVWSDRQLNALKQHRDTIFHLLRNVISKDGFIGTNSLLMMESLNFIEGIPIVLEQLDKKENNDLYTLLMLLMMKGDYAKFKKTTIYEDIYGPESHIRSAIDNSQENRDLIRNMAKSFFEQNDK
ncbi:MULTISPECIES: hypothetical protein [Sphingobacterium]|uniref:hypothetical protein n=1 Tax=Sphingobacterium TaxID=28453 RepID=UPI001049758F|nr:MULTISPECIES: hypothetical protein [Sphingobacterium]MCW2260145.1 hypothetical protein [Sphingobacterium kitahiroshimense]